MPGWASHAVVRGAHLGGDSDVRISYCSRLAKALTFSIIRLFDIDIVGKS